MHQMRMSWRLQLLRKFAGRSAHEAAEWRRSTTPIQMREEINQVILEAARNSFHAADANGRAILLGSIVSPAYLGKAKGTDTSCPWCGSQGTFMHLAWHCKAFPDASEPKTQYIYLLVGEKTGLSRTPAFPGTSRCYNGWPTCSSKCCWRAMARHEPSSPFCRIIKGHNTDANKVRAYGLMDLVAQFERDSRANMGTHSCFSMF